MKKETEVMPLPPISDKILETAVIYEANIRQYSEEGTFDAFTKDIPQLKKLGIKIIWVMPIFPISITRRKATGGNYVDEIADPEQRSKMLGSYYAISDYKAINHEFGTLDDFRKLVRTAHENDIYVILDWVPNHTGWDHVWIKEYPDFYTRNSKGEITDPLNGDGTPVGWGDVADLNYDNPDMCKAMIADMAYWLTEEDIDGFRCDMAAMVPTAFWQEAIPQLRAKKDIFMLAEAWEPELLKGDLFDMCYSWETHHVMNRIAQGSNDVTAWDWRMNEISHIYEKDDIMMNFVSNHDENSWNGSFIERMGDASQTFMVLTFLAKGMPLIYSGVEYGMDRRLKFFEKDCIPKVKGEIWELLEKLALLKTSNKALNGGKEAAVYTRINTNDNGKILAFERNKEDDQVVFIANLSKHSVDAFIQYGGLYRDYITGNRVVLHPQDKMTLEPWQYLILEK